MENLYNPMNELSKIYDDMQNFIHSNQDLRKKEIGDRVQIWDSSTACEDNGNDIKDGIVDIPYLIVIETRMHYKYKSYFCEYEQDLLLIDTNTNIKYRVNSIGVKFL